MHRIKLIAIAFTLNACTSTKAIISTTSDLDRILQNISAYKRVTGFGVSVFTKDTVLYQKAFGYSDLELQTPYTVNTQQKIASISKTTIAVALMKGQEMGLFSLDDPINHHLPFEVVNPYFPDSDITLRHLAMHTSSIKYSEQITDSLIYENSDMNISEFFKAHLIKDGKWYNDTNYHKAKPGELGDYSNLGATLAAYLVEYSSGMPFPAFVQKHIFSPLALKHTGYTNTQATQYYSYRSQNKFDQVDQSRESLYPSGDQVTTIKDLTSFCQAIMNGGTFRSQSILTANSVQEMLDASRLKSLDDEIHKQGIFWSTMKSPLGIPREMIGHNGGDYGIYTMMFFDQKSGVGYILLTNTGLQEGNHISMVGIYQSLWNYARSR